MSFRRVRLELESLERREVLSTSSLTSLIVPSVTTATVSTTTTPAIPPTDTSTAPADPANTVVSAQVTAVGPLVGNTLSSITVTGLPQNLSASSSITVTCGSETYVVTQATYLGNGQYTLTATGGFDPTVWQVGSTVTVTIGNGGNVAPPATAPTTPPTPATPPPAVPPIDPITVPAS